MTETIEMDALPYASCVMNGPHENLAWVPASLNHSGGASEGMLVFWGAALTAVLSRVAPGDAEAPVGWHLEFGAGPCDLAPVGRSFSDLDAALAWITTACGRRFGPASSLTA